MIRLAADSVNGGSSTTELWILGLTAVAAFGSAVAGFMSVRATRRAAEISRVAALLASAPLLIPWTPAKSGYIEVVNRGGSTSHSLRWEVHLGDGKDHQTIVGSDRDVIAPLATTRSFRRLTLTPEEATSIVDWLKIGPTPMRIVCDYGASWGQSFKTTRIYMAKNEGSTIRIEDENGKELKLST